MAHTLPQPLLAALELQTEDTLGVFRGATRELPDGPGYSHARHVVSDTREFLAFMEVDGWVVCEVRRNSPSVRPVSSSPWSSGLLTLDVPGLFGGQECVGCAPWLFSLVMERAASPLPLDRFVALGAILRLWAPTTPTERRLVLSGGITPVERARRVVKQIPRELAAAIEAIAVRDAGLLTEELLRFETSISTEEILNTLHHRDDLACVQWVLSLRHEGAALRDRLHALDADGERFLRHIPMGAALHTDPRLSFVSAEPDAWWGGARTMTSKPEISPDRLITPEGEVREVRPANGTDYTLEELQGFVGGYIELVPVRNKEVLLVVDEEGRLKKDSKLNPGASVLAGRVIVGTVLLVRRDRIL